MTKPVLKETMQIGIVVRNLDAAIRRYEEDFGIGPWEVYQFKPDDIKAWREHGQVVEPSKTRFASAMIGRVMWELIEPLDEKGIFAQFLAENGEGVHHIAVAVANYEETLAADAKRGRDLILDCELAGQFSGIKVAYLDTPGDLGVVLEVFSGLPEGDPKPDAS